MSNFLNKKTKNILKVKKFIKKKFKGGRLNELNAPNKSNINTSSIIFFFNFNLKIFEQI